METTKTTTITLMKRIDRLDLPTHRTIYNGRRCCQRYSRRVSVNDDDDAMQNVRAVFVGAASATGKSTMLHHIRTNYSRAMVSNTNYENLWRRLRDHDATAQYMRHNRDDSMIYEHTHECLIIYPIIHDIMKRVSRDGLDMSAELTNECYRRVCSNIVGNITTTERVLVIDTTKKFHERYFERLRKRNNRIDYDNETYLYLQVVAYVTLMEYALACNVPSSTRVLLIQDDDTSVFGKPDRYDVLPLLERAIVRLRDNEHIRVLNWNDTNRTRDGDTRVNDGSFARHGSYLVRCRRSFDVARLAKLVVDTHTCADSLSLSVNSDN